MSKDRDVEILVYKIKEIENKIINFEKFGISRKKIEHLLILKLKYEDQLSEIELS